MTARRFTDKPDLDPAAVRSLPDGHPAMVENRTLFPGTVVTVTQDVPDRLLVSGRENRKLGSTIAKGRFRGYELYQLSLEERATCPTSCSVRGHCYGNGSHLARRHRIGDPEVFYDRLGFELCELLDQHPDGVMVRLHVLGDFPSVEYISFWADVLNEHPKLAIFGYTHRLPTKWGGNEIGDAIESVKSAHRERFRIRWSDDKPRMDGAVVIDFVPEGSRAYGGALVCPAQTDATASCSTCGLCWEASSRDDTIAFIKHGPKSEAAALASVVSAHAEHGNTRRVAAISIPAKFKPKPLSGAAPRIRMVRPTDLRVELSYQRDLSGRSISLIRKIVTGWDWAKLKPPICAETDEGLFVIDGQHTAIAAASHPEIETIPVMVVAAAEVEKRADAFVAHNRDRLAMSALQIFLAEVASGVEEARAILDAVTKAGGKIPRATPVKASAKPGEVIAITAVRRVYIRQGAARLRRLVSIAVASGVKPISTTVVYGLQAVLGEPRFAEAAALPDERLALALGSIANIEMAAQRHGSQTGQNRYRACAVLITDAARALSLGAAA